ncbi:putative regulator [Escherichia coli 1-176-05_S1_C3]|nr:putative regulator [Escherichia coli 1-176-05_S1_C1]EZK11144.1 putative regulator [Escherichia coli 1-176-05_S1_C3]EZK25010.1 putative regulator [Escherichia coli 1-176-05_S1_C2]
MGLDKIANKTTESQADFKLVASGCSSGISWIDTTLTGNASSSSPKEGANKRGNSSRLTQSFHFFMFEPIFSPVNALNQPI